MPRDSQTHCAPIPPANPTDHSVVVACRSVLAICGPIEVADEYGYASLPLRVIDSVSSIGVRHVVVRAKLRVLVKRILRKYGYPPDKQEQATATVLEQAELLCEGWA